MSGNSHSFLHRDRVVNRMTGTIEKADGDSLTIRVDGISDAAIGDRVTFQIARVVDDWPRRREEISKLAGVWKDDEEIGAIFDEIMAEKARQAGLG